MATDPVDSPDRPASEGRFGARRLGLLVLLVAALAAGWHFRDAFELRTLAARELELREAVERRPFVALGVALLIYAAATALSLPVAGPLSLVYGWLFGFWRGVLVVSFASTWGATGAFLLSRYLFGERVQRRYAGALAEFNRALEREGAFYLFSLRLIPYVPFFVINVVMGLTRMRVRTFWWASQLGMLPGTCVYLWAGSSVVSLETLVQEGWSGLVTPRLALAFLLLGLFPLVVRRLAGRRA